MTFYRVIEELKKGLPSLECEGEKNQENTEAKAQ